MAGFSYNGHSTEDFLTDDITVGFFGGTTDGYGIDRELKAGTPTLFRPIPNEYGTLDTPAEITFTLIKCGAGMFTKEEQVRIETWLTEPKLSIPLYFTPSGKKSITGPTPYYYGIFTKTEWIPGGKGFQGVNLVFQPTTAYPFMKVGERISVNSSDIIKKLSIPQIDSSFIYPIITLKQNKADFSVENETLGDKAMSLTGISGMENLEIDCKNCIITDLDTGRLLSFTDIGWNNVSNISWLRLRQGTNNLSFSGACMITITYEIPFKKVGGWFE